MFLFPLFPGFSVFVLVTVFVSSIKVMLMTASSGGLSSVCTMYKGDTYSVIWWSNMTQYAGIQWYLLFMNHLWTFWSVYILHYHQSLDFSFKVTFSWISNERCCIFSSFCNTKYCDLKLLFSIINFQIWYSINPRF